MLWQNVANHCVKPDTNIILFEVTQQDKISQWANTQEDTAADQPMWKSSGPWILASNSQVRLCHAWIIDVMYQENPCTTEYGHNGYRLRNGGREPLASM